MASSVIKGILIPEIDTTNPGSGTANATVETCSKIKYGKLVNISARIKILNNISDAMNSALLTLNIRARADMHEKFVPSFVKVNNTAWANLIRIRRYANNTYYAEQQVASTLNANDYVEMYFSYIAE